ncbi:MAG: glycosyltransferase [Acidobacteria bacterium]|nr:glycosyltransferase [Acidobacteriota bacterium]
MPVKPLQFGQESGLPKVGVVLLTYNQAPYLRASMDSLLNQTFRDFELIVINDCSPDETREILQGHEGKPGVQIIHHEVNRGLQWSTHEAIQMARGQYILWTSGDDVHHPELLQRTVAVLDRNPQVGFVYTRVFLIGSEGQIEGIKTSPGKPELERDYVRDGLKEFQALLRGNHIVTTGAVLFRRECYEQVGGLDSTLPEASDWDLWLRMAIVSDVAHLAEPLFYWRRHEGTLSQQFQRSGQYYVDMVRVLEKTFSHLPLSASKLRRLRGPLLAQAYFKLARTEFSRAAASGANGMPSQARLLRTARSCLRRAFVLSPRHFLKWVNLKQGLLILLGLAWASRAVDVKRRLHDMV